VAGFPEELRYRGSFGPVRVPEGDGIVCWRRTSRSLAQATGSEPRRMMRRISCTCSGVQIGDTEGSKPPLMAHSLAPAIMDTPR
jgi:hypothetical protein